MKRWFSRGLLILIIAAGVFWAWRAFFPGAEQVIRKRMKEASVLASFGPNEAPLAKFSNTQKLLSFFAPEVEIDIDVPGHSMQAVSGTEDLRNALMGARSTFAAMQVEFLDITIKVDPGKNKAVASTTVRASISGERDTIIQEMRFSFSKTEGDWLISRIETVNTLH